VAWISSDPGATSRVGFATRLVVGPSKTPGARSERPVAPEHVIVESFDGSAREGRDSVALLRASVEERRASVALLRASVEERRGSVALLRGSAPERRGSVEERRASAPELRRASYPDV
jgi:hypothetical protein